MAAIFTSDFESTSPAPLWHDQPSPTVARRPGRTQPRHLRVVEGGRSPRSMDRVYRRRRAAAALVALVALVLLVLGVGALFGVLDAASGPVPPAAVTPAAAGSGPVLVVHAGDTLSSVARRLQPSGSTTALVDRLAAVHGPGPLQAGDRLPLGQLGFTTVPAS